MTEPSQYFKGRTVQEQMNEVIGYVDARAEEVATTAIASDVAQVHQDMLDADADAQAAAASAAAAAGTLANAVKKTGEASQSIAGDIAVAGTLSGGVVTGTVITAPAPVNNTDAATKKYVDDADATKISISNINQHAVGLTGNQDPITGEKTFRNMMTVSIYDYGCGLHLVRRNLDVTQPNVRAGTFIESVDGNGQPLFQIIPQTLGNGRTKVDLLVRNSDGTMKAIELGRGD